MNVTTLNANPQALTNTKNEVVFDKADTLQALPANVVSIRSARKAQEAAKQELIDYLLWTLKHEMDPHRLYDDPIDVFRNEFKNVVGQD
jgi:hypothetical protein